MQVFTLFIHPIHRRSGGGVDRGAELLTRDGFVIQFVCTGLPAQMAELVAGSICEPRRDRAVDGALGNSRVAAGKPCREASRLPLQRKVGCAFLAWFGARVLARGQGP